MYLSKYPVTSKTGNEYRVDVFENHLGFIGVAIFKYSGLTKFRKREKFKHLYGNYTWDRHYDPSKHEYDYVKMATLQIEHYEELLAAEEYRINKKKAEVERFENWDGNIE